MTDLHDLLDLATDRVEAPGRASAAIAEARRRRARQRTVLATAAVVTVVAGIAVAGRLGGDPAPEPMPAPSPPTRTVEPRFDPRDVGSMPAAAESAAPLLPDVLDVPDLAPHVEDDPVDAAVLSIDDGADVLLLGTDGRWRCVVVPGKTGARAPVLNPDGTHLSVAVGDGFVVVDLATGTQTHKPHPGAGAVDIDWPVPTLRRAASDWVVYPVSSLGDGSILLRVEPPHGNEWWLVQWAPGSDRYSLVTSTDSDSDKAASFAWDLLEG